MTRHSNEGDPLLLLVGEALGQDEEQQRKFFVGKAGQELTNYLDMVEIPRFRCDIENLLHCRPPGNRDPKKAEIDACTSIHLLVTLSENSYRCIVTLGRLAARWFIPDADMDRYHGIPIETDWGIVIPCYHPAAGLHDSTNMSLILSDFEAVKMYLRGGLKPRSPNGSSHLTMYYRITNPDSVPPGPGLMGVDTETVNGRTWSIQASINPHTGVFIRNEDEHVVGRLAEVVQRKDVTVILHNAMFDIPQLEEVGVYPHNYVDTMVMAYLLQTEPQGLKPLAYRHLGIHMTEYKEMLQPYTIALMLEYLTKVGELTWQKPPKDGDRQPQDLNRRVRDILTAFHKKPDEVDLYDRWMKIDPEIREPAEALFGPAREATIDDVPTKEAIEYAGKDADVTLQLYPILKNKVDEWGLTEVLDRDMRMLPMVAAMQRNGMKIDQEYFRDLRKEFVGEMEQLQEVIDEMVASRLGHSLNPNSPVQVGDLLYKLRLKRDPNLRKGDTDHAALERVVDKHPVVSKILEWRGYAKLIDSYIDVLLAKVSPDGRIRSNLRITRVVTGRLSSGNPNLMAQPTRTEVGRKIRGGFVAEDGYALLSRDYSQIEMRVVAHISQDEEMMRVFNENIDLHSATASRMFHIPMEQVEEMKHRYPAKRVGFGILNLISARKLLRELILGGAEGWTEQDCQSMIDEWFNVYTGVRSWIEEQKAHARRYGYVRDMWGRVRMVPEVVSVHPQVREAGLRQGCNAPIQMGAQGIIKEAMGQIWEVYRDLGPEVVRPLIQIHDDIVDEVREDMVEAVCSITKDIMENCVKLDVPIRVDPKVGHRWNEMRKV